MKPCRPFTNLQLMKWEIVACMSIIPESIGGETVTIW